MNQNHPYKIALIIFLTGFLSAVSAAPGGGGGRQGSAGQTHPDLRGENQQQKLQERNHKMEKERNQQDGSWQLQEHDREREQNQLREHQMQK